MESLSKIAIVCGNQKGTKVLLTTSAIKNRFDVSSKGPSSKGPLLPSDVVIRYLHWPRIEVCGNQTLFEWEL